MSQHTSTTKLNNVAVIIPCFNEALTVGDVIIAFKEALPEANIIVCNNNSTDDSKKIALSVGAKVIDEPKKGKGYAVERLFREVEADYYVIVDADSTYDATVVRQAIEQCKSDQKDMLIGVRVSAPGHQTYLPLRSLGNKLFTSSLKYLFASELSDTLSGYRILSRRFVKSIPI